MLHPLPSHYQPLGHAHITYIFVDGRSIGAAKSIFSAQKLHYGVITRFRVFSFVLLSFCFHFAAFLLLFRCVSAFVLLRFCFRFIAFLLSFYCVSAFVSLHFCFRCVSAFDYAACGCVCPSGRGWLGTSCRPSTVKSCKICSAQCWVTTRSSDPTYTTFSAIHWSWGRCRWINLSDPESNPSGPESQHSTHLLSWGWLLNQPLWPLIHSLWPWIPTK
jgi:hypothetical protein